MVYKCCVPGCKNKDYSTRDKIPFHVFPKERQRFTAWLNAVKRKIPVEKRSNYRVCSIHFADNAKFPNNRNRTILKADAVPTLYLPGQDASLLVARDHSYMTEKSVTHVDENGITGDINLSEELVSPNENFDNNEIIQLRSLAQVYSSAREVTLNGNSIEKQPSQHLKDDVSDECSLFAELVAIRLRTLTHRSRKVVMHKVDDLLFKAEMEEIDGTLVNNSGLPIQTAYNTYSASPANTNSDLTSFICSKIEI